jgi:sugar phosphate isomerase/epimerase
VTGFGISTHLFHGERLAAAHIAAIAGHGFGLVELFATRTHFDYHDARHGDAIAGWLRDHGVTAHSVHLPITTGISNGNWGRALSNASPDAAARAEALDETRLAIDAAARLGCGTVVLHLGLPRGQSIPPGDNDPTAVRRCLEPIAAHASQAGVRLALELIPNDLSTPDALVEWLDGDLELGDAGVCLDFGHAHMVGGAVEAAERLAGWILTTHVHDNRGVSDDHLLPFAGTIDWPAALMAMFKVGYTGPLVFEIAAHGDAAGVLARAVGVRRRLQGILDDLATPFEFGLDT